MSYQPSITLHGIEQAIHGLGYRNESALKYRFIAAIKRLYGKNGEFREPTHGIESDELIRLLWDVDPDPDSLRSKKKNLSSIKSSINADFKRLYREGKNPEGVMIGPENLFTISDEAKDELLANIGAGATAAGEVRKIAGILSAILSDGELEGELRKEKIGSDLQLVRSLLKRLSEKMGLATDPSDTGGAAPIQKETDRSEKKEGPENTDIEDGTAESETLDSAQEIGGPEGEFQGTDPDAFFEDEEETSQHGEIDAAALTEVSEGEVYETLEEIEEEEEEDLEVIEDTEVLDEDMEFCGEIVVEDEGWMDGVAEDPVAGGNVAEPECGGGADEALGSLEIQEEDLLAEGEEETSEEYDIGEEAITTEVEEGLSEGPEEIPFESGNDAVEALEVEEDLGEIEEEAEGYDDDVLVAECTGEEVLFQGEAQSAAESSQGGPPESAPVQGLSVGEEAGGTEETEKGNPRILSEKFNSSLSEMDRLYNQYLLVTAGEYTLGSTNPKENWNPARRVRLSECYIGKFPVTNALFDVFVEKTGYRTTAERIGYGTVYYGRLQRRVDEKTGRETVIWNSSLTSKIVQGAFWYQPLGPGSNLHHKRNHPVVQISLEDAMAFAAWTGKRLPTEEEWEAASRTMKGSLYPWGNKMLKDACNVEKSGYGDTTPVDRYLDFQNEYGIADAMGNVMEWTTGRFEDQGKSVRGTVSFIAKGGSWITAKAVTLANRTCFGPEFHSNNLGFRCVAN
jgi:formylglycine-generating enzyme required for sulfatase activity